jgi:transposase-like protein
LAKFRNYRLVGVRYWAAEEKRKIVAESLAPGASMAEVARRHGVNPNLRFTWRRYSPNNSAGIVGCSLNL